MSRLSPHEKKRLSYARDGRNDFGENDKASRRLIPLRKRKAARSFRKLSNQQLTGYNHRVPESADSVDSKLGDVKRPSFRKTPDIRLGDFVARQKALRARRNETHRERAV